MQGGRVEVWSVRVWGVQGGGVECECGVCREGGWRREGVTKSALWCSFSHNVLVLNMDTF